MYTSIISLFLFIGTIVNAIFYIRKLIIVNVVSELHIIICVGFGLMILFNLPYKINLYQNNYTAIFDGLFNGLMYSYVLCFSLIIAHALMADPHISRQKFYLPKVATCSMLMIVIWMF